MIPVANEWLICCGSLIAYRLSLNIYLRRYLFWTKVLYLLRRYLLYIFTFIRKIQTFEGTFEGNLHNNGVKWCKVAWRNNSAHTDSHKLYLWLRSTAAVSGAQRPRPHRILRVSEGPSILAWPTLNMVKNYRGRIWSEATKDCPRFLRVPEGPSILDWPTIHRY